MPAVTRLGDICTGHGCFPSRSSTSASATVFADGIQVHRQSDSWDVHCCGVCHDSILSSGSATVYADGLQVGRIGDPIACGSSVASGSATVFAGG
jgi:uncharacterized Zn-binding protein involved in type VI secretion